MATRSGTGRATDGARAVVDALYRRYNRALLRQARAILRDPAAAEDVVQETWEGALAGLPRFEGRSSLRTWLFRILVYRARTRAVLAARTVPISVMEAQPDAEACLEAAERRAVAAVTDPETAANHGQVLAAVEDAMACLPRRQRAVVVMRDVEGLGPEEACDRLGLTPNNQRVLLHRARRRLRGMLQRQAA